MYFDELAKQVRFYKENMEGARSMSQIVDDLIEEFVEEARIEYSIGLKNWVKFQTKK